MIKKLLILVAVLGLGAALGRFAAPSKVVEKEKIVYQDKIVEKIVKVEDTKQKTKKVKVKFVTILPDGTQKIEEREYDTTEIQITQEEKSQTERETQIDQSKEKTVEFKKPEIFIAGQAKVKWGELSTPTYGLSVNKRFLGPIYLGAFGYLDKSFGVAVGLQF